MKINTLQKGQNGKQSDYFTIFTPLGGAWLEGSASDLVKNTSRFWLC